MEQLPQRVNADERLVWRGRFLSTTFMVESDDDMYLVKVSEGRIASVTRGPFAQPSWSFAMRAPSKSWEQFWLPLPPPGFNDLLALIKHGGLRVEGDMHVFMANLLYFKAVMATLRTQENA